MRTNSPPVRFLVVGSLNTVLSYSVFRTFLWALSHRPAAAGIAQAAGYTAGMVVGYVVHRAWTFRSDTAHGRSLPRFVAVQTGALVTSSALVQWGVARAGLAPTPCWAAVTATVAVIDFLMQRHWVFPRGHAPTPAEPLPA